MLVLDKKFLWIICKLEKCYFLFFIMLIVVVMVIILIDIGGCFFDSGVGVFILVGRFIIGLKRIVLFF